MREIFYDSKLCYKLGHGVLETLTTQRKFKRRRARASLMEMTDVAATFGSRPCEELKSENISDCAASAASLSSLTARQKRSTKFLF